MQRMNIQNILIAILSILIVTVSCNNEAENKTNQQDSSNSIEKKKEPVSQPLVSHIYTADPSAHLFNGRIYIYP